MSQSALTLKIDNDVKAEAQELAKKLGLSLSAIVENQLRLVVKERRVVFEEELLPTEQTAKDLARIERDVRAGRHLRGPFSTHRELEEHLVSLGRAD